ncbi:MAG: hypothetical protein ABSB76_32430 [Streptosporangiaceae bacterium]|jgi:hypothetical protein
MSINQADQAGTAEAVTPLLRSLGEATAAVCTDGFCAVPPGSQPEPGSAAATGADE